MIYLIIIALLAAAPCKRDVRTLIHMRFQWPYLLLLGFVIQVCMWVMARMGWPVSAWLFVSTWFIVLVGLLRNTRLPGIKWISLGTALNLAAILMHHGVMPVYVDEKVRMLRTGSFDSRHLFLTSHDSLWWLGDWMHLWRYTVSLGDVFVGVGIFVFVLRNSSKRREV